MNALPEQSACQPPHIWWKSGRKSGWAWLWWLVQVVVIWMTSFWVTASWSCFWVLVYVESLVFLAFAIIAGRKSSDTSLQLFTMACNAIWRKISAHMIKLFFTHFSLICGSQRCRLHKNGWTNSKTVSSVYSALKWALRWYMVLIWWVNAFGIKSRTPDFAVCILFI